ncbi:hypothetical protein D5S17_30630 [Pseudonocardiaceae bacterium YIM PH 21723]|nr:hypothetical protein D5S17_30630 [Pseudonocardiaceae bacterium YIM PH 21723]
MNAQPQWGPPPVPPTDTEPPVSRTPLLLAGLLPAVLALVELVAGFVRNGLYTSVGGTMAESMRVDSPVPAVLVGLIALITLGMGIALATGQAWAKYAVLILSGVFVLAKLICTAVIAKVMYQGAGPIRELSGSQGDNTVLLVILLSQVGVVLWTAAVFLNLRGAVGDTLAELAERRPEPTPSPFGPPQFPQHVPNQPFGTGQFPVVPPQGPPTGGFPQQPPFPPQQPPQNWGQSPR